MRCVIRSEPKSLAAFPSLNARRLPARAKIPDNFYHFEREVFVDQHPNSWRFFPVWARGVFRSEPKFLAAFPSLGARCLSVSTKIPGDISQCACEVFVRQNQNAWRFSPVSTRGVFRPEPKFLAARSRLNARSFLVRTKIPGGVPQFECEAFFGQNQNSWQYIPVQVRGVFRPDPKFLAIVTCLNARRVSVRTEIPGAFPQFQCEVFVGQSRNSWQ